MGVKRARAAWRAPPPRAARIVRRRSTTPARTPRSTSPGSVGRYNASQHRPRVRGPLQSVGRFSVQGFPAARLVVAELPRGESLPNELHGAADPRLA